MNIYILPALIALIVKIVILFYARRGNGHTKTFVSMVLVFAFHNLCEVLIFLRFFDHSNFEYVLTAYYVTSIWGLAFIFSYAITVARLELSKFNILVFASAAVLTGMILATDLVVAGGKSIGYIMTAVRGPLYWMFQAFSIVIYASIIGLLIHGYRKAKDHAVEIQCVYSLFALLPLVVVSLGVIILMNLGFELNATGILPVATSAFLFIILISESQHKLTDIRRFMPLSAERKTSSEIMEIFSTYARDERSYRDAVSQIERLLVLHKYGKSGGNASHTAESMGMPRSSLYSIFNRLDIDTKE